MGLMPMKVREVIRLLPGQTHLHGLGTLGHVVHQRRDCRGVRAFHHEPDGAQVGSDGEALH